MGRHRRRRRGKGLQWVVLGLVGAGVVLTVAMAGIAASIPSRQIAVEPVAAFPVDEAAIERLSGAIRIPTVSHADPAQVDEAAFDRFRTYLEERFPTVHGALVRENVGGSLLYLWRGSDSTRSPILLMGHMDVVPIAEGTEEDWQHPPFEGVSDGTYVWGRGTLDDKVTVLGLLEAVNSLLAEGFVPTRNVYLAFGHDEEVGGRRGAAVIAEILKQRSMRFAFTLDEGPGLLSVPGAVPNPLAEIGIAEKGYLTVEIVARGPGGHSSRPSPNSAISRLAAALTRMESRPSAVRLSEPVRRRLQFLAPEAGFGRRLLYANLWATEPLTAYLLARDPTTAAMVRTTRAVTIIGGGVKENVLPTEAFATVNLRLRPGQSSEEALEELRAALGDPALELRTGLMVEPSPVSDVESPEFRILHHTIEEIFPEAMVVPTLVTGATDSRHYNEVSDSIFRFLPLRLTPDDLPRYHGTNERIAITNYVEVIRFYRRLIQNLNEPPGSPAHSLIVAE